MSISESDILRTGKVYLCRRYWNVYELNCIVFRLEQPIETDLKSFNDTDSQENRFYSNIWPLIYDNLFNLLSFTWVCYVQMFQSYCIDVLQYKLRNQWSQSRYSIQGQKFSCCPPFDMLIKLLIRTEHLEYSNLLNKMPSA